MWLVEKKFLFSRNIFETVDPDLLCLDELSNPGLFWGVFHPVGDVLKGFMRELMSSLFKFENFLRFKGDEPSLNPKILISDVFLI